MGLLNNYDISIVILHYNDAEMTGNYINNLSELNWSGINYHIIIVDNASPDKSGAILAKRYANDPISSVVLLDKNEGFARGNNAGIKLACSKYDSELIIVSNNDITIEDPDLPQKLVSVYEKTGFAVFGPDIYSTTRNYHQSPIRDHYLNVDELDEKIQNIDKTLRKLYILDKLKLYDFLRRIKRMIKPENPDSTDYDKYQEGVVLQGAFFVLSRKYLEKYPDGLYPETFLYMEEDFLNYRSKKNNLKSVYDPSIQVKHSEGASTHNQATDRCRKYIFELEQTRLSCLKMRKYQQTNTNNIT